MSSESKRGRLPFEPRQKKKKTTKNPTAAVQTASSDDKKPTLGYSKKDAQLSAIPEEVSKRMIRRMALFCGVPSALGFSSFFIFYWVVSHDLLTIPTPAVVISTLVLFGLGFLGLSYGLLSTSWDEGRVGGWFGWQEFTVNFGRMTSAWRSAKKETTRK